MNAITSTSHQSSPEFKRRPKAKTYTNYLSIMIGQTFSLFGSQIVSFSLIWWLTLETHSVSLFALVIAFMNIPPILLIPFAGVFADLWDRKKTIIIADFLMALTTIALAMIFLLNSPSLWLIVVIFICRGIFDSFHRPAVNAIIPLMVPSQDLSRVNGIKSFSTGLVQIIAPFTAAWLMTLFPIQTILWIDVVTFLIALVPLIRAHIPKVPLADSSKTKTSFLHELGLGFQKLKSTSKLLVLAFWSLCFNFLILPFGVLLPIFISSNHAGTGANFALVSILSSIGYVVGSLVGGVKKKWSNCLALVFLFGIGVFVGSLIVILAPYQAFGIMGVGQFIGGFSMAMAVVLYYTVFQRAVPLELQGRVYSIDMFLSLLIAPITIFLAGSISEKMGIASFFLLYAILGIIMNVLLHFLSNTKKSSEPSHGGDIE